jgi:hypothetical protein
MQNTKKVKGYLGNPNLKQVGEKIEFTQHQIQEYAKCSTDPIYFLENYGKIVSLDKGIVPFRLYKYQKKLILSIKNNRKILAKLFRQSGKSTTVAGFISWYCLFESDKNSVILANKMNTAKEIFSRVQFILENCPKWLQQGVKEWNKTSFSLENGSRVSCAATSASAIRGSSVNFLLLDEFAFLRPSLAEEFIASVFPTISSSETSKLVIVSTPNGLNHYYQLWTEAEQTTNGFIAVSAHWSDHPLRTQAWADEQKNILGQVKYSQEIECSFIGSSATLVDGSKLAALPKITPKLLLPNSNSLRQFEPPQEKHSYVMLVDTSRGKGLDYSAFTVIDITSIPYKVVCVYRNNTISTLVFPEVIERIANLYYDAFVLIETNDLGQQVADILFYDLEYENVYMSDNDSISEGGGNKKRPGLRTTKRTKAIGCDILKNLIENDKLLLNDADMISEMTTFIRIGNSYKADDGKTDDLAMTLVMFAYLTNQPVFKDLYDYSLREKFFADQLAEIDDQMLPLGYFDRGEIAAEPVQDISGWIEGNDDKFIF